MRVIMSLICLAAVGLTPNLARAAEDWLRFGKLRYAIGNVENRETLLANRVNLAHLHCPASGWAYNGFPERAEFDRQMPAWQKQADLLRAQGIHPITYIAPHMWYGDKVQRTKLFDFFDKRWNDYADFLGPRPADPSEWTQRNAKGEPIAYKYEGMDGYYWCLNDPRTRQYVQGVIKMHVAYGSHGVFFDGPIMFGCYCDYCRQQFRDYLRAYPPALRDRLLGQRTLDSLAPPTDTSDRPLVTAWRNFRCDSLTRFLGDMRAYGRSLCPDYLLTNNYCLWTGNAISAAGSLAEHGEKYATVVDILFDEAVYGGGPLLNPDGQRASNSYHYDYLVAAAGPKPAVCTFLGVKDTAETALESLSWLEIAESWASQCGKMQQSYRSPAMNEVFRQAGQFQVDRPDLFAPARPYANVGLWVSLQQGQSAYPSWGLACARLLQDQGIAYRMLVDGDVTAEGLEGLDAVILPGCPVLTAAQRAALERFASAGGGLVALGACGITDEHGFDRPEAQRGLFAANPPDTGLRRDTAGKGLIVWAAAKPFSGLPECSRNALAPALGEDLARMVKLATRGRLTLAQAPSLPVECRAYRVGADRLRVYLVNYGVTREGQVTDLRDVTLKLALPAGMKVKQATAQTAGPGTPPTVTAATAVRAGQSEATFSVPALHIWTVLDVRLAPLTRP